MSQQQFPHMYEYGDRLKVIDRSSTHFARVGEVMVTSKPGDQVRYTLVLDHSGYIESFYENQLTKEQPA